MTKAAILPLSFTLLIATVPAAWAQTQATPEETAINEAIYRQANRVTLLQRLAEARAAQERRALAPAGKLYDEAWELVQRIGSGVEAERDQTIAGLAAVRLELARTAQSHGQLEEAETQINDILRVDPSNADAIEFKRGNQKLMAEQRGTVASAEVKAQVPAVIEENTQARTLVQDGKLLYELGKLDEAEAKLRLALRQDPRSQAGLYYLSLVSEAKYTRALKQHGVTAQQNLSEVEQAWANPVKRELLPVPNPYAHTNLIHTSPSRQAIVSKLDRIRLDSVRFEGLPLSEVIINLSDESRKRDPEKRGINFLISQTADSNGSQAPLQVQIGPDGNPLPAPPPDTVDIGGIQIKINPPLTDIRLADALDAIIKVAEKPIKYSIEDYAIIFSLKTVELDPTGRPFKPLYVRSYRVDPNTFYQGLRSVGAYVFGESMNVMSGGGGGMGGGMGGGGGGMMGGGMGGGMGGQGQNTIRGAVISRVSAAPGAVQGGMSGGGQQGAGGGGGGGEGGGLAFITRTNNMEEVSVAARNYFMTLGVDLDPLKPENKGKALFFNDRQGMLIVRATMEELDVIEAAINVLNIVPPQVLVKAKFVEISQEDSKALGFEWYLGNVLMNNGTIGGQAGTAPSMNGAPTTANPLGTFPGNPFAGTTLAPKASDQLLTSGLRNTSTTLFTLTGILTDPQFRMVLHALENRTGAELLAQPEVTTQSGRQAQMKATDVRTIVTGFGFSQNQVTTGTGTVTSGTTLPPASFVYPLPEQMELGPVLDVIPAVLSDGYTINLTLIPSLTEFVGYEDSSAFTAPVQQLAGTIPGGLIVVPTVLPAFRVRQVASAVNVWDGQTVVLGGLLAETVQTIKDKIPMLGDLPLAGRFFRSEQKTVAKKNLLIFVTPTLIDPSGNRLHSEDEMPFAKESFPPQPPAMTDQANKQ